MNAATIKDTADRMARNYGRFDAAAIATAKAADARAGTMGQKRSRESAKFWAAVARAIMPKKPRLI